MIEYCLESLLVISSTFAAIISGSHYLVFSILHKSSLAVIPLPLRCIFSHQLCSTLVSHIVHVGSLAGKQFLHSDSSVTRNERISASS